MKTRNALHSKTIWGSDLRVIKLVAQGLSRKEIAAEMGVSEHTVIRHFYFIKKLTGTGNPIKWLLLFGDWIPKESTDAASDTVFAKPPGYDPANKLVRCTSCQKRKRVTEITVTGGGFKFPFCTKCLDRLELVRKEAEQRRQKEREGGRERKAPDLLEAMQKSKE